MTDDSKSFTTLFSSHHTLFLQFFYDALGSSVFSFGGLVLNKRKNKTKSRFVYWENEATNVISLHFNKYEKNGHSSLVVWALERLGRSVVQCKGGWRGQESCITGVRTVVIDGERHLREIYGDWREHESRKRATSVRGMSGSALLSAEIIQLKGIAHDSSMSMKAIFARSLAHSKSRCCPRQSYPKIWSSWRTSWRFPRAEPRPFCSQSYPETSSCPRTDPSIQPAPERSRRTSIRPQGGAGDKTVVGRNMADCLGWQKFKKHTQYVLLEQIRIRVKKRTLQRFIRCITVVMTTWGNMRKPLVS